MKIKKLMFVSGAILSLGVGAVTEARAQATVQTTTTTQSVGTISEFGPESIVIRSETAPEPIRYSYSKTTTYVDDSGAPVSIETVKSGLPVTVHYTKVGDRLVASRVVVRRAAVAPAVPPVVEKKTTTTTTTTSEKK